MKGRRGALGQYHASMSNNRGHDFEEAIRQACLLYANQGRAKVEKTPEPFRVLEKREGGIFVGRFTAHAQPDFLDYAHKIGGRWITGADCEIERWRRSK